MSQVRALLSNFSGGELSPRVQGRVDIKRYASGCRELTNALVVPHGGAKKRPGTKFIVRQKSNSDTVQLVYFQYSTEQAYVLVFGPSYVWFLKDQAVITGSSKTITGITKGSPAVVTAASHGFSNGDVVLLQSIGGMTELNNRHYVVASATTNTFALTGVNSLGYTTYTSGGTAAKIVSLPTTYAADEVADLQFSQINDVLYIAHKNHPLRKISRLSHTSWTLTEPDITTGPFRTINGNRQTRMQPVFDNYTISGATNATSCVLTIGTHSITVGQFVGVDNVVGMTGGGGLGGGTTASAINGTTWYVSAVSSTTITINCDSSGMSSYTSGGTVTVVSSQYGTYIVGDQFNLTCTANVFNSGHVGALFRLNEEGGSTGIVSAPVGNDQVSLYGGQVYTYEGNVYGVGAIYDYTGQGGSVGTPTGGKTWETIGRVPAHTDGTVRVYGSKPSSGVAAAFDSDFLHPGYCIVRVIEYVAADEVRVELVRYQLPSSIAATGTSFWEEGAWSLYRGYPGAITFFESRLWLAGSASDPTMMWASNSAAFESFEDGANDDDALVYRLASGAGDVIRWMSGGRILTAGTSGGEYAVAASNQNEALTPSNIQAKIQTTFGTSTAQPVRINQAVLYPQRSGDVTNAARKLREFAYSFQADAYTSQDLTIFSEHITGSGYDQICYVTDPDSTIYLRRIDGKLCACTYEREQEVIAWHRHVLGGTNAVCESIVSIPGSDGDEIYLSVARTIGGTTVKSLEVFAPDFRSDTAKQDGIFLDSAAVYSGSSTTTISGLNHLEGQTVDVLNNGNVERGKTVTGGRITLDIATTKAVIGLRYSTVIETTDIEAGARAGTGQSRPKKISQVWIRLLNSLGGVVRTGGAEARDLDQRDILYRRTADVMDSSPPLFTGLVPITLNGGWQRDAVVRLEHDDPLPFFVLGIVAELDTNG